MPTSDDCFKFSQDSYQVILITSYNLPDVLKRVDDKVGFSLDA